MITSNKSNNIVIPCNNHGSEESPLLHGKITNTPLDLVTKRLYFVVPINNKTIDFLNTIIYKDNLFWINYWSLTHTLFGIFWGILGRLTKQIGLATSSLFGIWGYLMIHTLFEIWELWAGGYFPHCLDPNKKFNFNINELIDVLMDTLFGLMGYWSSKLF